MRSTKICLGVLALICAVCSCSWAQDPGWPRKLVKPGGTVLVYQPQVDDWQNFTDIKWRAAFQLTPNGGKQIVGAASFEANDRGQHRQSNSSAVQHKCHEYVFRMGMEAGLM
jgi:hypothetical protein